MRSAPDVSGIDDLCDVAGAGGVDDSASACVWCAWYSAVGLGGIKSVYVM